VTSKPVDKVVDEEGCHRLLSVIYAWEDCDEYNEDFGPRTFAFLARRQLHMIMIS